MKYLYHFLIAQMLPVNELDAEEHYNDVLNQNTIKALNYRMAEGIDYRTAHIEKRDPPRDREYVFLTQNRDFALDIIKQINPKIKSYNEKYDKNWKLVSPEDIYGFVFDFTTLKTKTLVYCRPQDLLKTRSNAISTNWNEYTERFKDQSLTQKSEILVNKQIDLNHAVGCIKNNKTIIW